MHARHRLFTMLEIQALHLTCISSQWKLLCSKLRQGNCTGGEIQVAHVDPLGSDPHAELNKVAPAHHSRSVQILAKPTQQRQDERTSTHNPYRA